MCGIVGYCGTDPSEASHVDAAIPEIRHRGPDAEAVREWRADRGICRIGHTRLRVLDLTPAADQPLANEDETAWVAFNGEIYNFPELSRDLEQKGHRFATRSDTEALIHLYESAGGVP